MYDTVSLEARTDFAIRRVDVNLRIRISVAFQVKISRLETAVQMLYDVYQFRQGRFKIQNKIYLS